MKTRMMLLASIVLMGLMACSENEEMERLNDELVNTYLTVCVTDAKVNVARTLPNTGEGGVVTGNEGERTISNLMVLLYDESGVLKKAYVTDEMKNTVDGSQTAIFPMGIGKYEVYVVANFSEAEALWGIQPGFDVKAALVEGVDHSMMEKYYAYEHHFMMFNECNGKDRTAGVPIEITVANTYRNPATCTVPLDRLAVKIQSKVEELNIDGIKKDLDSAFTDVKVQWKGFKLLNGATATYLQQRWTNVAKGTYPYRNTLITPWLITDTEPVLFDYYAKLSDFRTVTFDENGKSDYVRDNYASMHFYGGTEKGPIYCMENNPTWNGTSVVDALLGNTTGVVYQFLLDFKGSDSLAGESCFYAYGGKYFPTLAAIQAAFPDVFSEANPSSADRTEDLAAAEAELAAAYQHDIYSGVAEFRGKYQIKVFMDGLMYYIYYIKDRNYVEGGVNYYAVMRNTVYDLVVRRLLRIGEDIPGGWNPDTRPTDPVDPTETYMNVVVKVNPWVMNQEDIELK